MITSVVGLVLILGIAFYSVRLLRTFRRGMLERSWKAVAISGLFLAAAQISYFLQALVPNASALIDVGILFDIFGSFSLLMGLRIHLKIWLVGSTSSASNEKPIEQIVR